MIKRHFVIFLFFHFLCINKFKNAKQQQLNSGNSSSSTSFEEAEYTLFSLAFKQNQLQTLLKQAATSLSPPDYVSLNSWLNCLRVESHAASSSHLYKTLTDSLRNNAKKWTEYLLVDKWESRASVDLNEKDIDLLNDTPLDAELTLTEKLIVWLIIRPNKVRNAYNY
jgi:hypothetical protein